MTGAPMTGVMALSGMTVAEGKVQRRLHRRAIAAPESMVVGRR